MLVLRQRFGISASVAIAISFWLSTTAVHHCINDGERPTVLCEKDPLAIFLVEHKAWPYKDAPFTGYWDNYDNKLASIIAEPYSRLVLAMALTYLVWLRISVYIRKRHKQAATLKQG